MPIFVALILFLSLSFLGNADAKVISLVNISKDTTITAASPLEFDTFAISNTQEQPSLFLDSITTCLASGGYQITTADTTILGQLWTAGHQYISNAFYNLNISNASILFSWRDACPTCKKRAGATYFHLDYLDSCPQLSILFHMSKAGNPLILNYDLSHIVPIEGTRTKTTNPVLTNHPNPFSQHTKIFVNTGDDKEGRIFIYDISGRLTYASNVVGSTTLNWLPSLLPAGVYCCNFVTKRKMLSSKLFYIK